MLPRPQDLANRLTQLKTDRYTYEAVWEEISNFVCPQRGFYLWYVPGRNQSDRFDRIIDNTAKRYATFSINGITSGLTSQAIDWFDMVYADERLSRVNQAAVWLNTAKKALLKHLPKTNFYDAIQFTYAEEFYFGTGCILVEELDNERAVHYHALTAGEYWVGFGAYGKPNVLKRMFYITASAAVELFGYEHVSNSVKHLYDNEATKDIYVKFYHSIVPNPDYDPNYKDNLKKRWLSIYWEDGNHYTNRTRGYNKFPAAIPRWEISGSNAYGISPCMEMLGDIKQLQDMQITKEGAVHRQADPPLVGQESLRNKPINTMPGGITFVDMLKGGGLQALNNVQFDYVGVMKDIEMMEARLRSGLFADLFLTADAPVRGMTATEVAERKQEKLLMLGNVVERQFIELLDPVLDITWDILAGRGIIPAPNIPQLFGQQINYVYTSPLATARKMSKVGSLNGFASFVLNLSQAKAEALDKLNVDGAIDYYADLVSLPSGINIEADAVGAIRKAKVEAMEEVQRQQQAQQYRQEAMQSVQAVKGTPLMEGVNAAA